jgi:hypothetical protein
MPRKLVGAVAALIIASSSCVSAQAQQASGIEVLVTPYLWLPWTSTQVSPANPRLAGASNTIGPYQLVSHLTWVPFMGAAEIRDGPYGLMLDYIHAPVKAGVSTRNVLFGSGTGGLVIDAGTTMAMYRPLADSAQQLDVGLGVRGWGLSGDISLSRGLLPPVSVSSGLSWADPLVGLRYRRDLGNGYSSTFYGDVGGFGIGAHIDWQLLATLDYTLRPGLDLHAGFRALNFNYTGTRAGFDVHMYGPIISATLRF